MLQNIEAKIPTAWLCQIQNFMKVQLMAALIHYSRYTNIKLYIQTIFIMLLSYTHLAVKEYESTQG